jgi:hypothetical protein
MDAEPDPELEDLEVAEEAENVVGGEEEAEEEELQMLRRRMH